MLHFQMSEANRNFENEIRKFLKQNGCLEDISEQEKTYLVALFIRLYNENRVNPTAKGLKQFQRILHDLNEWIFLELKKLKKTCHDPEELQRRRLAVMKKVAFGFITINKDSISNFMSKK